MHEDLLMKQTKPLSRLPGVAAIFLSGSRAQGHATKNSDIDLFIIAQPGRIWTARFFVYMTLFLTGKMRRPHDTKNLFCPNHFITADSLEIQEKDAYSANLFSHNIPLHDMNNIFVHFANTNQSWVENFGESFSEETLRSRNKSGKTSLNTQHSELSTQHPAPTLLQKITESFLKYIQKKKIEHHPDTKLPGAKIILTDTELRFHPRPKNKNWKNKETDH